MALETGMYDIDLIESCIFRSCHYPCRHTLWTDRIFYAQNVQWLHCKSINCILDYFDCLIPFIYIHMERLIKESLHIAFSLTEGYKDLDETNPSLESEVQIGEYVQTAGEIVMIAMSLVGCVGIVGNCLSMLVFSRSRMDSSLSELLIAISFVDMLVILFAIIIFGAQIFKELICHTIDLTVYLAYSLNYLYPISMMVQTASVWLLVVITIERYLVVCLPLKAMSICTKRRARISIATVSSFAIMYNMIRFWEYEIVETTENSVILLSNNEVLRNNTLYLVGYYSGMYLVVQFMLPFIIIFTLNVAIICRVMKARRVRKLMTTRISMAESTISNEHRIAVMMICIIIIFALCNTLALVLNIVEANDREFFSNPETKLWAYIMMDTSNIMILQLSEGFEEDVPLLLYSVKSAKVQYRRADSAIGSSSVTNNVEECVEPKLSFSADNDEIMIIMNTTLEPAFEHLK